MWWEAGNCRCTGLTRDWRLHLIGFCCAWFDVSPNVFFFSDILAFTPPTWGLRANWKDFRQIWHLLSLSFLLPTLFNWVHLWQTHWKINHQILQHPFWGLHCWLCDFRDQFNDFKLTRFWWDWFAECCLGFILQLGVGFTFDPLLLVAKDNSNLF